MDSLTCFLPTSDPDRDAVALTFCDNEAARPTGATVDDLALTRNNSKLWRWDGSAWVEVGAII
jgi:hypothetical protein